MSVPLTIELLCEERGGEADHCWHPYDRRLPTARECCCWCGTLRPTPTEGRSHGDYLGSEAVDPPSVLPVTGDRVGDLYRQLDLARELQGLSWRGVARLLGCGPSCLSRWGLGRGAPSAEVVLAALAWLRGGL